MGIMRRMVVGSGCGMDSVSKMKSGTWINGGEAIGKIGERKGDRSGKIIGVRRR
ncbi:hypothetical protein [Bacillus pumilus]|uniref:hypothetical protein n=1 Tax=Bacillus pumilus TaxID=1408 RepID=UPI001642DFA4|nr:hypothetical protein [Bacillus pumilus]